MSFKNQNFEDKKQKQEELNKLLNTRLKEYGFSRLEIKEVMDIIILTEQDIEEKKQLLAQFDLKDEKNKPKIEKVLKSIKQLQDQMSKDIKYKVKDIQTRKSNYKKEL